MSDVQGDSRRNDPRFPIGRFEFPATVPAEQRGEFLPCLTSAPTRPRASVAGLTVAQPGRP